jgi:hypothetical protein
VLKTTDPCWSSFGCQNTFFIVGLGACENRGKIAPAKTANALIFPKHLKVKPHCSKFSRESPLRTYPETRIARSMVGGCSHASRWLDYPKQDSRPLAEIPRKMEKLIEGVRATRTISAAANRYSYARRFLSFSSGQPSETQNNNRGSRKHAFRQKRCNWIAELASRVALDDNAVASSRRQVYAEALWRNASEGKMTR